MSNFITSTQIILMSDVMNLMRSHNLDVVGIYPTNTTAKYIVSTSGAEGFQTVNIYDSTLTPTSDLDFNTFVLEQI